MIIKRGLTKKIGRTVLSVTAIIIGVMLLTATTVYTSSIQYSKQISYEEANMADFIVYLQGAPESAVENISNLDNVKAAEGRLIVRSVIYAPSSMESYSLVLYGLPPTSMLDNVKITEGNLFSGEDADVIVLEETFGEVSVEDSVNIATSKGNSSLTLLGKCKSVWMLSYSISERVYGLAPLETVQSLFNMSAKINAVLVQVQNPSTLHVTMNDVKNQLEDYGVISSAYEGKVVPVFEFDLYMSALTSSLTVVGFLSVVIGAAFIYNILSITVSEDYGEIGTLKVLGMTRRQVVLVYMMRGIIVGGIGSIFGSILGIGLASSMLTSYASYTEILTGVIFSLLVRSLDILEYAGLGVGLAILGAIIPSLKAGGTVIHKAITTGHEEPKAFAFRLDLSRFGIIPVSYAVGSLLRKRGRVIGLIITLALPLALSASVLPVSQTLKANADHYWYEVYKVEGMARFQPSVDATTIERMNSIEGVKALEPYYFEFVQVEGFNVPLAGVLPNTSMANYEMLEGTWLYEGNHVVLTPFLAERLNAHAGDALTIATMSKEAEVKVVGIVQDLVLNAILCPISFAQRMFNKTGTYNSVIVQFKEGFNQWKVFDRLRGNFSQVSEYWSFIDVRENFYATVINPFMSIMGLIFTLSWIASIAMVGTIIAMDVRGRLKDFATLRALGATSFQVESIILLEMFVVGALGGGLGILLSFGFVAGVMKGLFTTLVAIPPVFIWTIDIGGVEVPGILILWILAIMVSVLSGFVLIHQAAKVNIAEALEARYSFSFWKKLETDICPYIRMRGVKWYCGARGEFLPQDRVETTCKNKTNWLRCQHRIYYSRL